MFVHRIGGIESSSVALSYMFYTLGLHPGILSRIRDEVDPLMSGADRRHIPPYSILENLPYLNGFIFECERTRKWSDDGTGDTYILK